MPTKISNTNTNINKININVPRRYTPRPTKKNVAKAEQDLQSLETQDREIPYISQAPSQFINPSVFGFNTTPIQEPIQEPIREPVQTRTAQTQTQQRPGRSMATSTRNMETDVSPIEAQAVPFRSSGVPVSKGNLSPLPEYRFNNPSDFPSRLAQQSGFSPYSTTFAPLRSNRMRDIQKQGRPDINEMARNIISLRPQNPEQLVIVDEFGDQIGTLSNSPPSVQNRVESIEQRKSKPVFPKAGGGYVETGDEGAYVEREPARRGRKPGSKNKPKPKTVETQVGPSLEQQEIPITIVPRPRTGLRG
jgi:hypothetical protein